MKYDQRWVLVGSTEPYRTRRRTPEEVCRTERENGNRLVFENAHCLVFEPIVEDPA